MRNKPTSAAADQHAQAALRERVKELTCLYGIAQTAERPDASLDDVLQGVVDGIVASHGGAIEVETAHGNGTRFEVRLPLNGPEHWAS